MPICLEPRLPEASFTSYIPPASTPPLGPGPRWYITVGPFTMLTAGISKNNADPSHDSKSVACERKYRIDEDDYYEGGGYVQHGGGRASHLMLSVVRSVLRPSGYLGHGDGDKSPTHKHTCRSYHTGN